MDELSPSKSSRLPFLSWKWNNSVSSSSSSSRNRLVSEVGMMMMRGTALLMAESRTPFTWLPWVATWEVLESPLLTLLLFNPTGREVALRELVTSAAEGLRRTGCPSTFSKQLEESETWSGDISFSMVRHHIAVETCIWNIHCHWSIFETPGQFSKHLNH